MTTDAQSTDLLATAVAAGLVTAREVADGAVSVRGMALLLRGRAIAYAVAPAGGPSGTGEESATRQLRCLSLLADTGLVPEVLRGAGDQVVWTAALRGTRLDAVAGTMAELAETCQAWGAALAALHLTRIPAGPDLPVAPRPWVLEPDRAPLGTRQLPPASARAYVLRTVRADRGLVLTRSRVADRWSADHWTHADLTAARVVVQHRPELRVRFVDLRAGGLGDAAWDLAGALETIAELTAGRRSPWGAASGACLSEYLLQGYRRAGGTAVADAGTRALRIVARAWKDAVALDARAGHPASMHPAAGLPEPAGRLTARLTAARELAARSARPGLVAA
jgi:hypothetical protein